MNGDPVVKPIRFSAHARETMHSRGATEQEVVDAIRTIPWERAELARLEGGKP